MAIARAGSFNRSVTSFIVAVPEAGARPVAAVELSVFEISYRGAVA
jgi:hypothetical protein